MWMILSPEHADRMLVQEEASTQVYPISRMDRVLDVIAVGPLGQLAQDLGQQRLVGGDEAELLIAASPLLVPGRTLACHEVPAPNRAKVTLDLRHGDLRSQRPS